MKIQATVVHVAEAPCSIEELELDDPGAGEVLVKIHAVGVCHTDIAIQRQWMETPLPIVLGHEGAGVVEAVGEGVTKVAVGDKVALTFASCGGCSTCAAGQPAYCFEFAPRNVSGARPDGTNALHGAAGFFFAHRRPPRTRSPPSATRSSSPTRPTSPSRGRWATATPMSSSRTSPSCTPTACSPTTSSSAPTRSPRSTRRSRTPSPARRRRPS